MNNIITTCLFLFILAIILGLLVVIIIDKKLSDVTINIPTIKVPNPHVKVSMQENVKKNKNGTTDNLSRINTKEEENDKETFYENFVNTPTGYDIKDEYLDNALMPAKNNTHVHAYNGLTEYKSL